jgi:hypothetical protein
MLGCRARPGQRALRARKASTVRGGHTAHGGRGDCLGCGACEENLDRAVTSLSASISLSPPSHFPSPLLSEHGLQHRHLPDLTCSLAHCFLLAYVHCPLRVPGANL